ncbi:MAG: hypothetical protein EAZ42_09920 [Verrucomicrobia bacterium]|nr:MAG: hypothetical protein EAZ42_09920 [Verrucomicrobiota bacterium]
MMTFIDFPMSAPRFFLVLWLSATVPMLAQDAPPGVPEQVPTDLPPGMLTPDQLQANQAAAPIPAAELGKTLITEPIEEPKLSGDALGGLYRKYTGRRVIVSTAASTAEFRFVQDASPSDPLTYAEAAELLRIAATIENFVFVPDEMNPNLDILTLATSGIRPTGRGVDVYNENKPLPEGDAVISYVMNLNYIKPAEAVNTFTQIIGQFGSFGSIAPVPNAAAVVITENTSLIRKLIDLKKEIDKPSSQVGTRFIKVQYADVTEIATTLTELLTAQQSAQTTAGTQRTDVAGMPPGVPPGVNPIEGSSSGSGEATPIQIIPDPRTNRIFAMGRPVDLLFVEGLVREFDVETSEKNFLRRKLRFLTVSDFLPIAGDALSRAFGGEASPGSGAGGAGGSPTESPTNQGFQNNRSSRGGRSGSSGMSGDGSSGGGGGSGGGSALSDPQQDSAPESMLVGRTLLVADNITNSIVVQGPPSGLEIVERLLDQIDVKPDQIMISTVIGQLTLSKSLDFGLDYIFSDREIDARGGGGGGPILPINPTAMAPFNPGSLAAGAGLRMYGLLGNNMNIYLNALQTKTDFTVLSRPSIFTSNNQKGVISSGERIAIPTNSNSFSNGGASTNIEYQDVVLKLEVIPLVNSENEITLQIALLNDEQNGTQTIQGAGNNGDDLTVPRISTREILTTVTVPNNETIVLGGLIIKRDNETSDGIPILSDIPLLGKLFSSNLDTNDRSELIVFIQPSIVNNRVSLDDTQADMDRRYSVSDPARRFADGPGVLPAVGTIPLEEVEDKGISPQRRAEKPTAQRQKASAPTKSTVKKPHRPPHRP